MICFCPDKAAALEYIEASSSLVSPEWEGGHTEIEMADINADGNLDLISIGDHGSPYINTDIHGIMLYSGDGSCNFTLVMVGNFGYGGIAAGDCNLDGFMDVGYGMHHNYSSTDLGDQLIEVAIGNGTGNNWIPWDDNLASQGEDYGMFSTDFGDIDNDGDLDLASTSFGFGNQLMVYRNQMDGTWQFANALTGGNCNMLVQFGDINKDGNVAVVTSFADGSVFFGTGTGVFYDGHFNLSNIFLSGVSLGDVDNDGGKDVAYCYGGGLAVWVFDESQTQWINYSGILASAGTYSYTQLCDMNSDGFCDIVAGGSGRVTVWTGDGAGNWTTAAQYTILNDPSAGFEFMRVGGDMDHNGFPDIVHLTDEGGIWNSYNHLRLYRESSPREDLTIEPVFPRNGEVFLGGSVLFIDWLSEVPRFDTALVDLEFSSSGAGGPWNVIAENLPNNGRYQWTVPADVNSSDCYIRYTAETTVSVQAMTPQPFSVYMVQDLVALELTPQGTSIVIPAGGGNFTYDIQITNLADIPCAFNTWIDVEMPDGSIYGPIILRTVNSFPVSGNILRNMNQNVPGAAMPGTYIYRAHIGVYANNYIWTEDTFQFEKSGTDLTSGETEWLLTNPDLSMESGGDITSLLPRDYNLLQNHPNPFNPETTIEYFLPNTSEVEITIFDITGRQITTLVKSIESPGYHKLIWNAESYPSGVYVYKMQSGSFTDVKKMILLK